MGKEGGLEERGGSAEEKIKKEWNEEQLEKEALEPATLQQEEEGKGVSKSGRQLVMEKLMVAAAGKMESRVILLTNMVGPEDVDEDLQEDVEQECNKYGKVDHIVIYQEKQDESDDAEVLVKIFVEFKESISAKKAKNGLDGRFFAGKTISDSTSEQRRSQSPLSCFSNSFCVLASCRLRFNS